MGHSILVSDAAFAHLREIAHILKETGGKPVTFDEVVDFVLTVADAIEDDASPAAACRECGK